MARKSKGRQKVAMVKMPNESNLQVTFSKRRSGLFKKASELSTLCGVEIGIIVFSPGKKVFSFGHPSVEAILERYLTRSPQPQASGAMQLIEAHRNANVRELNVQLTHITNQLEAEKKQSEELNKMRKASQAHCWWETPVGELQMGQLEQLKLSLEELKKIVGKHAERILIQAATFNGPMIPHSQFYAGSSSQGFLEYEQKNVAGFNAPLVPPPPPPPSATHLGPPAYNLGGGPTHPLAGPSHGHAYGLYGRDLF